MSTQRFALTTQFSWQNGTYEVRRLLPGSQLVIEDLHTGARRTVSFTDLAQALFAGELQFIEPGGSTLPTVKTPQVTLADYAPRLRAIAEYRLEVIRPLLPLRAEERSREVVAARVAEIQHARQTGTVFPTEVISIASIYRWLRAYEQSGRDIRALISNTPKQGGQHISRLSAEVEAVLHTVIEERYYIMEKVTSDDIYLEVALRVAEENLLRRAEEPLTPPSRVTVWRRIRDLDPEEKLIAKRGKRAAQQQFTQYEQVAYPNTPLGRVEIDHTRMDIIVVDGEDQLPLGRPTITYCLDTTTRYPLGFHIGFDPPSYLTVMECLHHALLPKGDVRTQYGTQHEWLACGIPMVLVVDNGKEFIGQDLADACNTLGIELQQMPIKTPHFKAAVERMFKTINTGLLHTLPGTTFSNPTERGDYASEQEACIDLADLDQLFHLFLLDIYAERFHQGLGDIPARRWEAITAAGFFPRLPEDRATLEILLGRVTYRVIQAYGIEFMHLRYNTPDLAPLRTYLAGNAAKIKYLPTDLGCIYVYDPQQQTYLRVDCLHPDYAGGLSVWKHRVITQRARAEQTPVDILGLARAKRQIQEIVAQSKAHKKLKSRARMARWETGGKPVGRGAESNGVELDVEPPALAPALPAATLPLPEPGLVVDLDNVADADWSANYDLPHQ